MLNGRRIAPKTHLWSHSGDHLSLSKKSVPTVPIIPINRNMGNDMQNRAGSVLSGCRLSFIEQHKRAVAWVYYLSANKYEENNNGPFSGGEKIHKRNQ